MIVGNNGNFLGRKVTKTVQGSNKIFSLIFCFKMLSGTSLRFLFEFLFTLITFVLLITLMMASEGTNINEIKKVISFYLPEADIIMFGSRARGDNQLSSDYDFLIISKDTLDDQQRLHFQALIRKSLAEKFILADIIIHSRKGIEKKRNLPGHIVRSAMKEGVRV